MTTIPNSRRNEIGSCPNPKTSPSGVKGNASVTITVNRVASDRYFAGLLLKKGFRLRITSTINDAEITDSNVVSPSVVVCSCWSISVAEILQNALVGWFKLHSWIGKLYFGKRCRTFAAIWRSVILSTISTPTMRPLSPFLARRFSRSPLASPGPKIKIDCAS